MTARIAVAQTGATPSPEENLTRIRALAESVRGRADLVMFPEYAMTYPARRVADGQPFPGAQPLSGAFVTGLRETARQTGLWLSCGVTETAPCGLPPYNTTVLITPDGELVRAHRKCQLYDAFSYRESDHFTPGGALFEPVDTPFGRLGLLVCYELRFPELARAQALVDTDILLVTAAFVRGPGKARQWHTLLSARAIENGLFVVGCNHTLPHVFLGESAAYAPDGARLCALDDAPGLMLVSCDLDEIARTRDACPAIRQRRTDLY